MLFWILAAALTVAVLLLIVPPLLKPAEAAPARDAYDREVYRDQLDELERDRARGLVNAAQAEAAKAEIARRMLAVAAPASTETGGVPRNAKALALVLALTVPVGALGVYGAVGRPDAPAQPLASRNLEQERGGPPKSVIAAIDKLKQQLAENPNDPEGWAILGQAYVKMNRPTEAADALRRAVALSADDTELLGLFGETLVESNDGTVPEEARTAFDRVLAKDPKDSRARFFSAMARYQAGDRQDALDRWRALLAESPANAAWVPVVRDQIREAALALNLDPAAVTPDPLPATEAPATAQAPQPQQPPQMSAEDRDQMVRGMVASLAAKMEADPSDVNGWLTLARSYGVLGDRAKAMEAVRNARERAPDRPDVLVAYASAVLQGLPRSDPPAAMPEEATTALRQALATDATNRDALWLLGLDAVTVGRKAEAVDYWTRLIALFQPSDPEYALLKTRLENLKAGS